ncbi:MAG: polysaccharide biosynthesis C-terminal domain-containing protein [Methyloligellaceae bacterium]
METYEQSMEPLPARPGRSILKRLSDLWALHGDAGVAFTVRVLSAVLVFGLQVFLARNMTLATYGQFVTISTWILVGASFGVLGFGESVLRFLPRYAVRHRWTQALRFFRFGLLTTIGFVTIAAGFAVLAALQMPSLSAAKTMIVLIAIGVPFAAADFYLEGVGRAMGWYKLAIVPTYIARPILIAAVVFTLVVRGVQVDAVTASLVMIGVLAGLTLAKGVAIAVRIHRAARSASSDEAASGRTLSTPPAWRRLWLTASLPLMAVYGLDDLLLYADILLLGFLADSRDVGVYLAAVRSLAIANFIHYAFMLVTARQFSVANSLGDRALLQQRITDSSRMTCLLTIPAVLLTLVAGYPLLLLFGEKFTTAYPVMFVLGAGLIARSSVGQAFDLLAVMGHARAIVWVSAGCLTANVVLSVILIPLFGIMGAAVATAIVMLLRAGALAAATHRLTGLSVLAFGWHVPGRVSAVVVD